jgi:hypothetical protein
MSALGGKRTLTPKQPAGGKIREQRAWSGVRGNRPQLGRVDVWRNASPSARAVVVGTFKDRTEGRIGMRTRASQELATASGTPALSFSPWRSAERVDHPTQIPSAR